MSAEIINQQFFSLKSNINFKKDEISFLINSSVKTTGINIPNEEDIAAFDVEFKLETAIKYEYLDFDIHIRMNFLFKNKKEITPDDLIGCVNKTRIKLQSIIGNLIEKNAPIVYMPNDEDFQRNIYNVCQSFY